MHNPFSIEEKGTKCDHAEAQFMAMFMKKFVREYDTEFAFTQQHSHHKGIKMFGEKEKEALLKVM